MARAAKRRATRDKRAPRILRTKAAPAKTTSTAPVPRILNCVPSSGTEKDWQFEHAAAAGMIAAAPIPQAKDLRENWWSINDQGSTGSCVGWATADGVLRWHF
ncbi:MAG TPA: hypothetical protein VLW88_07710, partial [Hyphomicrobium sp.]|nr:hypothetical protein [Hyphomicrobium sp.]